MTFDVAADAYGRFMPPGNGQASQGIQTFTAAELATTLEKQNAVNPRLAEVTEFLSLRRGDLGTFCVTCAPSPQAGALGLIDEK